MLAGTNFAFLTQFTEISDISTHKNGHLKVIAMLVQESQNLDCLHKNAKFYVGDRMNCQPL